jgi:hypothetical protein
MKSRKKALKTLLILTITLSLTATATSQAIEENEIWVHENTDSTITQASSCEEDEGRIQLEHENKEFSKNVTDGFNFTESFEDEPYGKYNASLFCSGNFNESNTFKLKKFRLSNPVLNSDSKYRGDKFEVKTDVDVAGGKLKGNIEFKLSMLGADFTSLSADTTKNGKTYNLISKIPEDPEEVNTGEKVLEINATYYSGSDKQVQDKIDVEKTLSVEDPWKNTKILSRTPEKDIISYKSLDEFNQNVTVRYRGNEGVRGLVSNDFFLTVEDENGTVLNGLEEERMINSQVISQQKGKYRLTLNSIPQIDVGEYNFKIGVEKDDGKKHVFSELGVHRYLTFSGTVKDSKGKPVSVNIDAVRDRKSPGIKTSGGSYTAQLLPGKYNMTVDLPDLSIEFRGVKISKETVDFRNGVQPIKYDAIKSKQLEGEVQGTTVNNAASVKFGIPFEKSRVIMGYDGSQLSYENVKVMQCSDWSGNKCFGEWGTTNSEETMVDLGQVSFPATPLKNDRDDNVLRNAFMVIKNTELLPKQLQLTEDRVARGSKVPVQGRIETPSGNKVSDVDVKISVLKQGSYVNNETVTTSSSGTFQANMKVPEESTTYSVEVRAEKPPFQGFQKTDLGTFDVYVPREIKLSPPDKIEFSPGTTSKMTFDVINGGQADAKNVKLRVKNLKNTWYDFAQQEWDKLKPGEQRQAVMTVEIPEDYCSDECTEYPKFNVEVVASSDGEPLKTVETVQAVVNKDNGSTQQTGSNSASKGMGVDTPNVMRATGDFLKRQSSLNIALGLVLIFLITLAGAVKHKQSSTTRGGRGRGQNRGRRGGSGRPQISNESGSQPASNNKVLEVSPKETVEKNPDSSQTEEKSHEETREIKESEDDGIRCGKCGEEFDTESALDIHKQAIH